MEEKQREQLTAERPDELGLNEVWLLGLNEKSINENENAAWEIIKGAYCEVLRNDPEWHFFYENHYNIIRCSLGFYRELLEYLDECGVEYVEKGMWVDGQPTTRDFQHIFQPMFHTFSLMALEEYGWPKIHSIFDRVAHCFLNHQYFVLQKYRNIRPIPTLWESQIISENAMYRSHYVGRCDGIWEADRLYKDALTKRAEEAKEKGTVVVSKNKGFLSRIISFFKSRRI